MFLLETETCANYLLASAQSGKKIPGAFALDSS